MLSTCTITRWHGLSHRHVRVHVHVLHSLGSSVAVITTGSSMHHTHLLHVAMCSTVC